MCLCFRLHHSICHHGTQGISCSLFPPYFTHQKKGNLNILDLKYTHCHPLSLHILPHLLPSLTTHTQKKYYTYDPPPLLPSLTIHTLTEQVLHGTRVPLKILPYVSVHATLVPIPLQRTKLGGSVCCHHHCSVSHDKGRSHLLQAQRTLQSFRQLPTRSSEWFFRSECVFFAEQAHP